jgi:hypothetical protein
MAATRGGNGVETGSALDRFIDRTLPGALVLFGAATCLPILLTIDVAFGNRVLFRDALPSSPPADLIYRHWGFLVACVGALMIAAAFRPWLRFATAIVALAEKILLVLLVVTSSGQPWAEAFRTSAIIDGTISLYLILYFISRSGRPQSWIRVADAT